MRISDANIAMASGRHYVQKGAQPAGSIFEQSNNLFANLTGQMKSKTADTSAGTADNHTLATGTSNISGLNDTGTGTGLNTVRNSLLQELFRRMLQAGMFGGVTGAYGGIGSGIGISAGTVGMSSSMMSINQFNYYESEETSFSAKGIATTEDGRELDFDVSLFMSRTFASYTQINIPMMNNALLDPLMINVGAGVANISDQTFRFDLDMDGEEEEISMPGKGTAFLALDLNEDGIINDGSELFGVKSGDGFADLAIYDSDGNGWIDENDEIFQKLRVWYKNADGTDELIDLKEADIGAIYLGSQATDFSLYGADLKMNGMIRATGLFLRESGGVGSVQHVDLAVNRNDAESLIPDDATLEDIGTIPQGALLIDIEDNGTNTQNNTSQRTQNQTQESDSASAKKAKEEARKKEMQEKHLAEADRRKASLERYQRRKQLRREQLEALLADREQTKEQLEEALEEQQMKEDAIEERYLEQHLTDGEVLDAMTEETLQTVA